ncbi:MAG TPA: sprT domain-containing protein [Crocinitomix sp.]|nr:sprT domain-containing protein [Crocinitomix sp.]
MKSKYIHILNQYLPANSAEYIADLIIKHKVNFKISKPRKTKLGDYRYPKNGHTHRISVNGDLNPYSFLITSIHEFAHLTTYNKYQHAVTPHGNEWKKEFVKIFTPLFDFVELPDDISRALHNYFKNPKASSCTDDRLMRVLKRYDLNNDKILVENLKIGEKFKLNSKTFVKGKRLRKYYLCKDLLTGRHYRVNGLAQIKKIQ